MPSLQTSFRMPSLQATFSGWQQFPLLAVHWGFWCSATLPAHMCPLCLVSVATRGNSCNASITLRRCSWLVDKNQYQMHTTFLRSFRVAGFCVDVVGNIERTCCRPISSGGECYWATAVSLWDSKCWLEALTTTALLLTGWYQLVECGPSDIQLHHPHLL